MVVRLKEWIIPYTAWDWIDISDNHVISVLLREANNLIHINEDREMYVDLQLDDGIEPTDDFPVWVTTWRILAEDWRPQNWIILNWKTTSGDYVRLIYAADWKLYYDPWTWVWNEIWWWGWWTCDCNVKLFTLSGATDLTTAQAILDWQKAWKDAIISYNNEIYMFKAYKVVSQTPAVWLSYNHIVRDWLSDWYSETYASAIEVNYNTSNNTVSSISFATYKTTPSAISPDTYYSSPFMPTQPYQPASKAYVDQMVSWVYIYKGSVATYSDLANIQNPEVWDVYNVVDSGMNYAWTWTAWDALWWTINYTAWDWIWINNWVISNTKPGATVSPTAPSNPSEWDLWYDTTNDVLKSYDGSSWNECGGGDWSNVKAFPLSWTSGSTAIAEAQAAYDWYVAGKEPIMIYNGQAYLLVGRTSNRLRFVSPKLNDSNSWSTNVTSLSGFYVNASSWTVTGISTQNSFGWSYLSTNYDYPIVYTPLYAGSPTTKQYVDDKDTYVGSSAPSTPYEWQLWYDTTNDVVKAYDWSQWNTIWSWGGWGWGDVYYADFNWVTASWSTVTMDMSTQITPSVNFTVNAPSTIKEWQTYILRVTNGATAYTMTLGTDITNPNSVSTTLTANKTDQFVFLGVGWKLELQDWWSGATYGTATSTTEWVIKLGSDTVQTVAANSPSSTASRTYPVQLNSSWQAVVNVPWTDSWGWWGGWSYTAWDWINISAQDVISNTMYPTNASQWQTWDILMKSANGTEWLTTDWIYSNVKCWDISSWNSTTQQAIVDWVEKGTNYGAILKDSSQDVFVYSFKSTTGSSTTYYFISLRERANGSQGPSTGYTTIYNTAQTITTTNGTVTSANYLNTRSHLANVIEPTGASYAGYFTPTADYHPATKKYVDDAVAWSGSWWIICDPNSPITITKIWAWTESQYQNLSSYDNSTAYLTI